MHNFSMLHNCSGDNKGMLLVSCLGQQVISVDDRDLYTKPLHVHQVSCVRAASASCTRLPVLLIRCMVSAKQVHHLRQDSGETHCASLTEEMTCHDA